MLVLKKKVGQALADACAVAFPGASVPAPDDLSAMLEYPPDPKLGDLAFPCFRLSRSLRAAPPAIAAALAGTFACDEIRSAQTVGGYLNFFIDPAAYAVRVMSDIRSAGSNYGSPMCGKGKTVVLDYSSPNVAKPFHIGHLGTTVIGHSLKLLHQFAGYHCIGINHLGDWGTQFGKLIVAYRRWGSREEVEKKEIDELVRLYVRFHAGRRR